MISHFCGVVLSETAMSLYFFILVPCPLIEVDNTLNKKEIRKPQKRQIGKSIKRNRGFIKNGSQGADEKIRYAFKRRPGNNGNPEYNFTGIDYRRVLAIRNSGSIETKVLLICPSRKFIGRQCCSSSITVNPQAI